MSSDKVYVYSTLSNDQVYAVEEGEIFIAGKANVSNKHFLTPKGVVTPITEDQLEQLRKNIVFRKHSENGFLVISTSKVDPEDVARDMAGPDNSAQDTEETAHKRNRRAARRKVK